MLRAEPMDDRQSAILAEIPRLRRYAQGLLRERDKADDLVQDTLERALARLDNWRNDDSPRRWLFTIMHHIFIDQGRKVARRGEKSMLSLDSGEALAAPATPVDTMATLDILDALQAIAPERRAALMIVGVEGFSYAEAADILGIPAGTLMSRISRGRDDLRQLLDGATRRRNIRVVEK